MKYLIGYLFNRLTEIPIRQFIHLNYFTIRQFTDSTITQLNHSNHKIIFLSALQKHKLIVN